MHWIALRCKPETDDGTDPLTALAWWALRFTPLVARVDDTLVLEVSGSERLFGGRSALLAHIFKPNSAPCPVEYAQGATSLIATGRLWSDLPQCPVQHLPVHCLQAARPHAPTLSRLGVRHWGQLRALPRGGLVRRFGAELLDALDRAYGQRREVYPWLTLPEVFDAPLELSAAVESAEALLFGARRLLAQLLVWLRARSRGVLALELVWELDARRSNALHVDAYHPGGHQGRLALHTAEPTQDMQHLQRLLGEHLAHVTLPAPVLYLRLRTLQTQPLGGDSWSLLPQDVRPGDSLHQMLERLVSRLGAQQVQCVEQLEDHRPEHMQRWQPWAAQPLPPKPHHKSSPLAPDSGASDAVAARPGALIPSWLLPVPQALPVHGGCPHYGGPLTLLRGPQRLEAGWLEGDAALRDYFVARSARAGLVWIFRDRLPSQKTARWFLHGLFA